MARFLIFLLPLLGLTSACSKSEDIYSLECQPSGKAARPGSPMGFVLNEPKRQIFWMGPAGELYPIDVATWDDSQISGAYKIGSTSVSVDLDRKGGSATLRRDAPDGSDVNIHIDSCEHADLNDEEKKWVLDSSK